MKRAVFIKKLMQAALTVFGVLVINYFLFRIMPGDPASMLARNPHVSVESMARINAAFGLDKPWYVQFGMYLRDLFRGDLGDSFIYRKSVALIIWERTPATLLLTLVAEVAAIVIGMALGVGAAWKRGKPVDVAALGFALVSYSMPTFWLGILLVAFFAGYLHLFPVSGMISPALVLAAPLERLGNLLSHLFLPALTLTIVLLGEYALIMRNSMIDVLTEDYIVTARAKGLSEKDILRKHAIPNAMIPMATIIAMSIGVAITGALQVETVFSWPGIGRLTYDALKGRDYPLLQGIFLFASVAVVGANFIADIVYSFIDPRVRA